MRKLTTLLVGLMLGWASASFAQNHPELAWQVVETEHFRIFYHEGLEGAAARAARIAEAAYAPITELYGYAPRRAGADRAQGSRRLRQWRGFFLSRYH